MFYIFIRGLDKKAVKNDFYYHPHNFDQLQFSKNFLTSQRNSDCLPQSKK